MIVFLDEEDFLGVGVYSTQPPPVMWGYEKDKSEPTTLDRCERCLGTTKPVRQDNCGSPKK